MEARLDIERAFTFVFKDPEWFKKAGIAALLYLSILGSPAVMGWVMEVQRRAQEDNIEDPLPGWQYLGDFFIDGLKMMVITFIWFLPVTAIYLLVMAPVFIMPFLTTMEDPSPILFAFPMMIYLIMPVMMVLSFLMYLFLPIITGMYMENRQFSDAFNLKRAFSLLKANFWNLLAAIFLGYLASYAAGLVGMLLCFVGIFLVSPNSMAIMYHFFGQAYRIARIKLGEIPAGEAVPKKAA